MYREFLLEFKDLLEKTKAVSEGFLTNQYGQLEGIKTELEQLVTAGVDFEKFREIEKKARESEKLSQEELTKLKENLERVNKFNAESRPK